MAEKRIDQLDDAGAIATTQEIPVVQSSVAKRATIAEVMAAVGKSATVDFGTKAMQASATITDADVTTSSQILLTPIPTSGRDADECEMEPMHAYAVAGSGSFVLTADAIEGPAEGIFTFAYLVG